MTTNFYAVVTFGSQRLTNGSYPQGSYLHLDDAIRDAKRVQFATDIRVLRCSSRKQAREACISDEYPVAWAK